MPIAYNLTILMNLIATPFKDSLQDFLWLTIGMVWMVTNQSQFERKTITIQSIMFPALYVHPKHIHSIPQSFKLHRYMVGYWLIVACRDQTKLGFCFISLFASS